MAKTMLRGKTIAINTDSKNKESSQKSTISFYLVKVGKEEKVNSKQAKRSK
jgi:hypothetical protein